MRIESIEWRNFNSYGNVTQRIDLPAQGELYNLHGHNGAGKSTIAEVLTFALYGRVEGKNKSDLVSRANKSMWCRVRMRCKGKEVVVERGVAPVVFEVTIDGGVVDTAGTANVQDFLEDEVYEVPYAVFKNVLVLRISEFKSFLSMTPADKRNIVDRLFGFSVVNQMRERLKVERKDIKDQLALAAADVRAIAESVSAMEMRLEEAVRRDAGDREKMLADLKGSIRDAKSKKEAADAGLAKVQAVVDRLVSERAALVRDSDRLSHEVRASTSRLDLLAKQRCPYCTSDLTGEYHAHMATEVRESLDRDSARAREVAAEADAIRAKLAAVQSKADELRQEAAQMDRKLQRMMSDARSMLSVKGEGADAIRRLLDEAAERSASKEDAARRLGAEDAFLGTVDDVLGDGGVKSYAMKSMLPSLNNAIKDTARRMHVPYDVYLNEAFDCVVTHMGVEISARTMSTGERKKADIAIIVSLVRMLKVRYPSLNLLFLDELFVSMDAAGVFETSKLLLELCREHGMNIWVMHHAELPGDMFDKQVAVVKDAGFSKMSITAS